MSLLTDSNIVASITNPAVKAQESSVSGGFDLSSGANALSSFGSGVSAGISSAGDEISSNFYSNLHIVTDSSSLAAAVSSDASGVSHFVSSVGSDVSSAGSHISKAASSSGVLGGGLDDDSSSSSGKSSSSSKSNAQHSYGNSYLINQDKKNWKFVVIPLMILLPLAL
ncbi:hypothetical protein BN7_3464 [Wickerhamomyces ciferrii]|uniref:Uncharacterized protein n=1 Tax=Wickerhamomyces ciferrii (strain ATCC 14091 / BCRC 22168 / CBS 111 / JCM 3599 / NBRC 0793 / NRRL Y-1031 F-60-10) TaxID=1206466 RepID=K0KRI8_WICCF|nr:uncharacterized protein BN7_3464 [Wickerhamomyces ciferrii]CCH43909.1 hypothetical protein BN7_3464 [Wickerhamomyces ciferrii]